MARMHIRPIFSGRNKNRFALDEYRDDGQWDNTFYFETEEEAKRALNRLKRKAKVFVGSVKGLEYDEQDENKRLQKSVHKAGA